MEMKKICALLIVLIPLFLLAAPAHASAIVSTTTYHNMTATMYVSPTTCPDGSVIPGGLLTSTSNGVMHMTNDTSGGLHFTATQSSSLTLVGSNAVTYTGHYTVWFGGNVAFTGTTELTVTFSAHATGTDGSRISFSMNQHFTVNPDGTLTSNINNLRC